MKNFNDPFRHVPDLLLQALKSRAAKWYGALWALVLLLIALKQTGIV